MGSRPDELSAEEAEKGEQRMADSGSQSAQARFGTMRCNISENDLCLEQEYQTVCNRA